MNRKNVVSLMLIAASLSAHAGLAEEKVWSYSKTNRFFVPHSWEKDVLSFEESAYTDILRVVDEINRKKGISKRYVLNNGRVPELTDKVDLVPIYLSELENYKGEGNYETVRAKKYYKVDTVNGFFKDGKLSDPENESDVKDFSHAFMQQNMRYFFGNGNKVKDIIIKDKEEFNKALEELKNKKQDKYLINGIYKGLDRGDSFNTLGITAEEYKKNFLDSKGQFVGVHNEKLLNFIKEKLDKKVDEGTKVVVKDGELWTEKNGELNRIQWNANPASRPEFPDRQMFNFLEKVLEKSGMKTEIKDEKIHFVQGEGKNKKLVPIAWEVTPKTEELQDDKKLEKFLKDLSNGEGTIKKIDDRTIEVEKDGKSVILTLSSVKNMKDVSWYKNTLLTQINIFKNLTDRGRYLYTTDGSIIVENVTDGSKLNPRVSEGWSGTKPLDKDAKTKVYQEIISDYKNFKENKITKEAFEEKWDLKNDKDYDKKLEEISKENDKLEENKTELTSLKEKLGEDLYYDYFESWKKDKKQEEVKNGKDKEIEKKLKDKNINLEDFKKMFEKDKTLKENIEKSEKEIPQLIKKQGFERLSNADVIVDKYGKTIEFRGRGRVDGTIDFGKGENRLQITEQFTGRYGTNIVFGPNVKLKNMKYIAVGGQYSASTGGVGLSGKSSLTLEIDKDKHNKDGKLYQHALKDTWTEGNKIVLKSWEPNPNNRNDFAIELKISTLGKDEEIDMGRPLEYEAPAFFGHSNYGEPEIKVGDKLTYQTNFYSDSIAHELILVDKGNEKEKKNGILKVHVKDSLFRLNKDENKVFKSLSHSGKLGYLSDTLTTSNKKTQFSSTAEEDKFEKQKIFNLMESIVNQDKAEDILSKNTHLQVPEDKLKTLIENLEKLKKDETVKKAVEQIKTLDTYKKVDTKEAISKLEEQVKGFKSIIPPDGISYSQEERIAEKIKEKYGDDTKINAEIDRLSKYAEENFKGLLEEFKKLKPEDSDKEVITGNPGYSAMKIGESIRKDLEELKNPPEKSSWKPNSAIRLAKYIIKFRNMEKLLEDLKTMSKNDVYKYIVKGLETDASRKEKAGQDWINVITNIFFTQRQNESLKELKIILNQVTENNIYSKVNKISKNEIDVFTPVIFDTQFDLRSKKSKASGGAISGRYAREKFKGTIYSGYGMYEMPVNETLSAGFVVGGANSNFHEVVNDNIRTITTNSKIKGTSGYVGTFGRYNLRENLNWINGIGLQYGSYKIDRHMKNNYQEDTFKGKLNTKSGNVYTGLTYKYKIKEGLDANVKGILSYTLVNQGKAKEEDKGASIEVKAQNFNYLDGQLGVGLTKTIYGNNITSSLSGTLYTVYGISGYKNNDLKGKFIGSTSEFDIKGANYDKQSMKLKLDYNVYYSAGLNYGLEGSYTKNSDENNISIGVKAGYTF